MAEPELPSLDLLMVMDLMEQLGAEATQENIDHLFTLLRAFSLYAERTKSYGQVWRQYGAVSNLLNAARKVDRAMELWWHKQDEILDGNGNVRPLLHKDNLDDPYDAINYLVFMIRNARSGNVFGEAPDRPRGEID